jgi:hypothetical protein
MLILSALKDVLGPAIAVEITVDEISSRIESREKKEKGQ